MLIALHKNARTKPAVRAEIAASEEPASVLAKRFSITEQTVYKWKTRDVFAALAHGPLSANRAHARTTNRSAPPAAHLAAASG
jgi:hypothetical protein